MIACTSPGFTVRSRPFKISLPSISACRFFISSSAISNKLQIQQTLLSRLAIAPAPAEFTLGLAADNHPKHGEDQHLDGKELKPNPRTLPTVRMNQNGRRCDDRHRSADDRPALPRHGRGAVAISL